MVGRYATKKLLFFLMFANPENLNACFDRRVCHNVFKHHDASVECLECDFLFLFVSYVVCLQILEHVMLHLSCHVLLLMIFIVSGSLGDIGQLMLHWLHWKFPFT